MCSEGEKHYPHQHLLACSAKRCAVAPVPHGAVDVQLQPFFCRRTRDCIRYLWYVTLLCIAFPLHCLQHESKKHDWPGRRSMYAQRVYARLDVDECDARACILYPVCIHIRMHMCTFVCRAWVRQTTLLTPSIRAPKCLGSDEKKWL